MTTPRLKLVIGFLIAASVLSPFLLVWRAPREPVYNGKPLGKWLPQLLTNNRPLAEAALQEMGTNAIPFLERQIRTELTVWRTAYRAAWAKFPVLLQQCFTPPTSLDASWNEAIIALQALGPSALPAMTEWLTRNAAVRLVAILVIREADPGVWPNKARTVHALVETIRPQAPGFRQNAGVAASALGSVGPDARDAVPELTALVNSDVWYNRSEAAEWRCGGFSTTPTSCRCWSGNSAGWRNYRIEPDFREGHYSTRRNGRSSEGCCPLILAKGTNAPLAVPFGLTSTRQIALEAVNRIEPAQARVFWPTGDVRRFLNDLVKPPQFQLEPPPGTPRPKRAAGQN